MVQNYPLSTIHKIMTEQTVSLRTYYIVYGLLLVLLGLTVAVAYLELGAWGIALALTIAVVKATLVILYFMHVRYSNGLIAVFAVTGFVWLLLLLGLTMSDYLSRGWVGG